MVLCLHIGLRLIKTITENETKNFVQLVFMKDELTDSFCIFDLKKLNKNLSNPRLLYNCYVILATILIGCQYAYILIVHDLRFSKFVQIKFSEFQLNLLNFTRRTIEYRCKQTNVDKLLIANLTNDFIAYSRICDLNIQIIVIVNLFYQLILGILAMHLIVNLVLYRLKAFRFAVLFILFPKAQAASLKSLTRPEYFFPIIYIKENTSLHKLNTLVASVLKQIISFKRDHATVFANKYRKNGNSFDRKDRDSQTDSRSILEWIE